MSLRRRLVVLVVRSLLPAPAALVAAFTTACNLSHPALEISVSVANGQTQLTAGQSVTVQSDVAHANKNPAVTWSLAGDLCPACGSLSNTNDTATTYTAPPFVNAASTVTVTATAVADPSKSASVTLTLLPSTVSSCATANEAAMNGRYAFLVRGGGANGPFALAGTFEADGAGKITSGIIDRQVLGGAAETNLAVSSQGSGYWIGSDGRGCIAIAAPGISVLYRFALAAFSANVSTRGRLIEFDDPNGTGSRAEGFLRKQDPASFATSAIQGSFAFGVVGVDGSGARVASVGVLTAAGGALTGGRADTNDSGTLSTTAAVAGTYAVGPAGRGTLVANGATYVIYSVSSGELIALLASGGGMIASGELRLQQSPGAFGATSLGARAVEITTGIDAAGGAGIATVGLLTPDGAGNATLVLDRNDAGTFTTQTSASTYTVESDGRATLASGSHPTLLYLFAPNHGFLMSTDASTMFGSLEPQASGTLGSGTLSGSYSFGTEGTQIGKRPTWVGTIVFQGSSDQLLVDQASPSGLTPGASLPVTTDSFPGTTSGRGTLDGAGKYLAYIVSASQLAWIDTTAARPTVVVAEK